MTLPIFPEPSFDPMADARRIIEAAIVEHDPSHIFAMFSGGNDSVCAAHAANRIVRGLGRRLTAAVHIATGIGIKETRRHAYEIAQRFEWPFLVYRPRKGNRYHEIVVEHGFPGPFMHRRMYSRLKERSIRNMERDFRVKGQRLMLITGVRKQESRRRMGTVNEINREGSRVWCAPITNWSSADKEAYMAQHGIPGNPVTAKLCMSGECLCGAFASPGELEEIRFWYPKAAQEIDRLAEKCRAAGVHATWGTRPPPKPDERQIEIPMTGGLCWSCDAKFGNREGDPPLEIAVRDPKEAA